MNQPARRRQSITVGLPASLTRDIPHLREKTARLGFVARALATFRVERVIIYHDRDTNDITQEARLIEKMLAYIETPQYLRKHFFKMDPDLQFAGAIPPLRAPNHPNRQEPAPGLLREGAVIQTGGPSLVEAGFSKPVSLASKLPISSRITIRLTRGQPNLEGEIVDASGLTIYWGFRVGRGHVTLQELVRRKEFDLAISTSRKGESIRQVMPGLTGKWNLSKHPLIVFGSPDEGVPEILARSGLDISTMDYNLNTIPTQGVETVRTEEAVWSSLAVLNILGED